MCKRSGDNFFFYKNLKRESSYFVFQTSTEDMETSEATEVIEGTRHEVKQSCSDTRGDTFQGCCCHCPAVSAVLIVVKCRSISAAPVPSQVDSHIMKVVQQIVNQASSGHQIIVQNVTVAEGAAAADAADTITIATPESLTEQVAMTLASAIGDGAVLATDSGLATAQEATVTMVASEDIEIMEHAGEFVIAASQEGDVEVQTVIV